MTKYNQDAELNVPISKGRYYGVMIDLPISWQGFTFAAWLRVGSRFTPMTMFQIDTVEGFMRFKIQMNSSQTAEIDGSGKAEIQVSILNAIGEVFDVLTLNTFIESNKPIIGGNNE